MTIRAKRVASLVLIFSMVASLTSCSNGNKKKKSEIIEAANTFLDAAVSLNAKKVKKLAKELGVDKEVVSELEEVAENDYVAAVMSKATYEIDEESFAEKKEKYSVEATIRLPDYAKAVDQSDGDLDAFKEAVKSQKEKNFDSVKVKLVFKAKDDAWTLTNAKGVIDDLYGSMGHDLDPKIVAPTPTPTPSPTPSPTPTETPEPTPIELNPEIPIYSDSYGKGDVQINVFSMSAEFPNIIGQYFALNPDLNAKYTVHYTYTHNDYANYENLLNYSLVNGGEDAPDIYLAESDYLLPYTEGDFASFAEPYSSFIDDLDGKIENAGIAQYSIDLGTNNGGEIVGLGYQSNVGVMIYHKSIAKAVLGTDDPDEVGQKIGAGSQNWDKFLDVAEQMKSSGYAMVSGIDDVMQVSYTSSNTPWIIDGKFNIDSSREAVIDLAKALVDNDYTNSNYAWGSNWYDDMVGHGPREVFAWFGPAWFVNYVMARQVYYENRSFSNSDYAVCEPPVGYYWGGTWIFANKQIMYDSRKKEFCADFIEWVTLDTTKVGFQYSYANGLLDFTTYPDSVLSGTVMEKTNGTTDVLHGQNPFPIISRATAYTSGKGASLYDRELNSAFSYLISDYADGFISREQVLEAMYEEAENLGLDV